MKQLHAPVILASASPRRKELLERAGIPVRVVVSDTEEHPEPADPPSMAQGLAAMKARAVLQKLEQAGERPDSLILAADTMVVHDGRVLGKPADEEDAVRTLQLLQGKTHQVYTGVCLIWPEEEHFREHCFYERTDVTFYPVSEEGIRRYVAGGEPMDKAGSYGIQGSWAWHVRGINGDYYNVVGLPVPRLLRQLTECGISPGALGQPYTTQPADILQKKENSHSAFVFDLDGTLLYTLDSMAKPANRFLRELGFPTLPVENFRYYCGDGADNLVRRVLKDAGDPELKHFEEAAALYRTYFSQDALYMVREFPGMTKTLKELKKRGFRLSVCSNKPHEAAVEVIGRFFPGIFDTVIGQSDRIRIKPAPDAPLEAASVMGVSPEQCIYVGDSGTDMKTGKAACMYTVGVLWGYRTDSELLENGADGLIRAPEELLQLAHTV